MEMAQNILLKHWGANLHYSKCLERLHEKRCSCGSSFETGIQEVPAVAPACTDVPHRPAETEATAAPARMGQVAGRASRENVGGRCWRVSERSWAPVSSLHNRTPQVLLRPALLPTGGCADLRKLIPCKRRQKRPLINSSEWLHTTRLGVNSKACELFTQLWCTFTTRLLLPNKKKPHISNHFRW